MMTGQIVLGAALIVMGALVTWLRFSPQAKVQQDAGRELAKRRAQAEGAAADGGPESGEPVAAGDKSKKGPVVMDRGAKMWNKRTAVLGPIGIALGLVLVFWGIFGQ
jgi:hypothetical protein